MIITAVTNEVHPDTGPGSITTVLERAAEAGITNFELRLIEGKRFPVLDSGAWDRLKADGKRLGITYSAVSPGLFMAEMGSELLDLHLSHLLPMSLDLAEHVGVKTLIVFAPRRSTEDGDETFERIVGLLGQAADRAGERGFEVQLENIPGSWADTGDNCLALLEAVGRKNFGYVWDTGNLFEAENRHFRESYEKLKPYIRNVHLKDGGFRDGEMTWICYGEGDTDVAGQIAALKADDYQGTLVLEAACKPHHIDDFPTSVRYLKSLL